MVQTVDKAPLAIPKPEALYFQFSSFFRFMQIKAFVFDQGAAEEIIGGHYERYLPQYIQGDS